MNRQNDLYTKGVSILLVIDKFYFNFVERISFILNEKGFHAERSTDHPNVIIITQFSYFPHSTAKVISLLNSPGIKISELLSKLLDCQIDEQSLPELQKYSISGKMPLIEALQKENILLHISFVHDINFQHIGGNWNWRYILGSYGTLSHFLRFYGPNHAILSLSFIYFLHFFTAHLFLTSFFPFTHFLHHWSSLLFLLLLLQRITQYQQKLNQVFQRNISSYRDHLLPRECLLFNEKNQIVEKIRLNAEHSFGVARYEAPSIRLPYWKIEIKKSFVIKRLKNLIMTLTAILFHLSLLLFYTFSEVLFHEEFHENSFQMRIPFMRKKYPQAIFAHYFRALWFFIATFAFVHLHFLSRHLFSSVMTWLHQFTSVDRVVYLNTRERSICLRFFLFDFVNVIILPSYFFTCWKSDYQSDIFLLTFSFFFCGHSLWFKHRWLFSFLKTNAGEQAGKKKEGGKTSSKIALLRQMRKQFKKEMRTAQGALHESYILPSNSLLQFMQFVRYDDRFEKETELSKRESFLPEKKQKKGNIFVNLWKKVTFNKSRRGKKEEIQNVKPQEKKKGFLRSLWNSERQDKKPLASLPSLPKVKKKKKNSSAVTLHQSNINQESKKNGPLFLSDTAIVKKKTRNILELGKSLLGASRSKITSFLTTSNVFATSLPLDCSFQKVAKETSIGRGSSISDGPNRSSFHHDQSLRQFSIESNDNGSFFSNHSFASVPNAAAKVANSNESLFFDMHPEFDEWRKGYSWENSSIFDDELDFHMSLATPGNSLTTLVYDEKVPRMNGVMERFSRGRNSSVSSSQRDYDRNYQLQLWGSSVRDRGRSIMSVQGEGDQWRGGYSDSLEYRSAFVRDMLLRPGYNYQQQRKYVSRFVDVEDYDWTEDTFNQDLNEKLNSTSILRKKRHEAVARAKEKQNKLAAFKLPSKLMTKIISFSDFVLKTKKRRKKTIRNRSRSESIHSNVQTSSRKHDYNSDDYELYDEENKEISYSDFERLVNFSKNEFKWRRKKKNPPTDIPLGYSMIPFTSSKIKDAIDFDFPMYGEFYNVILINLS